jgi:hypothetical protein
MFRRYERELEANREWWNSEIWKKPK